MSGKPRRTLPIGGGYGSTPHQRVDTSSSPDNSTNGDGEKEEVFRPHPDVEKARRFNFDRLKREIGNFISRLSASSKKPGFAPWVVTIGLIDLILIFFLVQIPSTTVVVSGLVLLFTINFWLLNRRLRSAYSNPPVRPAERLAPETGLPARVYQVNTFYGRPDVVPGMKTDEARDRRRELLESRIIELYRLGIAPTIWIGNSSGKNVKSMMSVIISSIISTLTNVPCYVIPTMANAQTGRAGKLTDLKGMSASMRQLAQKIRSGELEDPADLHALVKSAPDGAFVISEDPEGDDDTSYFMSGMYRDVVNFIGRVTPFRVMDTGNDGAHKQSVTVAGIEMAHVVIITAWVQNVDGLDKLHEALGDYWRYANRYLGEGKPMGSRDSAEDIPVREKVEKAIIAFNAVQPDEDLSKYSQYVRIGAQRHADFQGTMSYVRYDNYLRNLLEGFSLAKLDSDTYVDYLAITALCFERTAELMGIDIPERHPAIENFGKSYLPTD